MVIAAVTVLALGELGIRALYFYAVWSTEQAPLIYERVFWAVPPWVARTSIMYSDPELGLWMKPDARRTYVNLFGPIGSLTDIGSLFDSLFPELPEWARTRPVWHLRTNSLGLRGEEIPPQKSPDTFRIVVMGDSWTVGINVEEEFTYAAQLHEILSQTVGSGRVEVLNFGVIGAGAETGVRLLRRVVALDPDLVVVAYAQNDEAEARDGRPKGQRPIGELPHPSFGWTALLQESELYKLYQWWRTPGEDRIAETLRRQLTRPVLPPSNSPGRPCPNDQAMSSRYAAALGRIVRDLKVAGIPLVLLYNNVPNFLSHCTGKVMQSIARAEGLPMVDSSAVLEAEEQRSASSLEQERGLVPIDDASRPRKRKGIDAVFRVDMTGEGPTGQVYVTGNAPALGGFVPNAVALFDDGSHGDQVAGDGVWSRAMHFDAPQILTYLFSNGAEAGEWTGIENYRLRSYALRDTDVGQVVELPVEKFGVHALRSDSSHPDALGYRAIAEPLASVIRETPAFAAFARAHPAASPRLEAN